MNAMKRMVLGFLALLLAPASLPLWAQSLPTPQVLPQRIYGLLKSPVTVYLDTLVFAPEAGSVLYDATGPGAQYNERLMWNPQAKDSGKSLAVGFYSGSDFRKLAEASAELVYCDPAAVKSHGAIRWLAIGDSLTLPGAYISQVIERLRRDAPQLVLTSVGTQNPKDNASINHEGRGGWTWGRYLGAQPPRGESSPFVFGNRGVADFNFARYLREHHDGKAPEVITIFLGANDVYSMSAGFSEEKVNAVIDWAQKMVVQIRAAAPRSVIGIIPPPPPSEQNGFGTNYSNGVTHWQYRRAMQHYVAGLLRAFDGRWGEGIYIVPGYLSFDVQTGYPAAGGRARNALHPTTEGMAPISLSISAWLVHLLSTNAITQQ